MDDGVEGSCKGRSVTLKHSIFELAGPILALPRAAKRFVALSVDLALCVLTVWLAFYLRLSEFVALSGNALWAVGASVGIALPIFVVSGLYRAIFRYSGWPALLAVAHGITRVWPVICGRSMSKARDMINAHLFPVLALIATASSVSIALSLGAIGGQSVRWNKCFNTSLDWYQRNHPSLSLEEQKAWSARFCNGGALVKPTP